MERIINRDPKGKWIQEKDALRVWFPRLLRQARTSDVCIEIINTALLEYAHQSGCLFCGAGDLLKRGHIQLGQKRASDAVKMLEKCHAVTALILKLKEE